MQRKKNDCEVVKTEKIKTIEVNVKKKCIVKGLVQRHFIKYVIISYNISYYDSAYCIVLVRVHDTADCIVTFNINNNIIFVAEIQVMRTETRKFYESPSSVFGQFAPTAAT